MCTLIHALLWSLPPLSQGPKGPLAPLNRDSGPSDSSVERSILRLRLIFISIDSMDPPKEPSGLTIIRAIASLLNRLDGSREYPAAALEALAALEKEVA